VNGCLGYNKYILFIGCWYYNYAVEEHH